MKATEDLCARCGLPRSHAAHRLTPFQSAVEVTCHGCKRQVPAKRDFDGLACRSGPLRIQPHAGIRWGRTCPGSGELVSAGSRGAP